MDASLEPQSNHELTVELFEKGQFFSKLTFKKSEIIIGRQPENDIQIPDKAVSRQHAKIIIENNEIKLIDLGSANGTFVDNQKITVQKVNNSSMIRIGQQILRLTLQTTVQKNGIKSLKLLKNLKRKKS
jgi:pSer/pThr/pTyr-binding forkhead associated (FHA) protein